MKPIRGLAIFVLASCATLSTAHALTVAEEEQLDELYSQAADITAGVEVGRATITAKDAVLLQGEAACTFSRLLNADEFCDISAIAVPPDNIGIDSIYYYPPEEVGHVDMDDWTDDVTSQIDEIWESYVEGSKAQSERIGYDVVPLRWALYPTLNKTSKVMTYGILLDFGGEKVINLTTVKFTRTGFVTMNVVTDDQMLAVTSMTYDDASVYASNTYVPGTGLRYADFKDGDKVAAIGAVGVLASVVGVKYGKGTLAVIAAAILLFAKKLWFLLLIIPAAIWGVIKKMAGRRDAQDP